MAGAGTLMGSPDTVLAMLLLVLLHSTALATATTTQAFTTTGPGCTKAHCWLTNTAHISSGNHSGAVIARELSHPITAENFAQLLL